MKLNANNAFFLKIEIFVSQLHADCLKDKYDASYMAIQLGKCNDYAKIVILQL